MVSWMQLWWQVNQTWLFLRHAYTCGWTFYSDVTDGWTHQRYAMAYAIAQVTPRTTGKPLRF